MRPSPLPPSLSPASCPLFASSCGSLLPLSPRSRSLPAPACTPARAGTQASAASAASCRGPGASRGMKRPPPHGKVEPPGRRAALAPPPGPLLDGHGRGEGQVPALVWRPPSPCRAAGGGSADLQFPGLAPGAPLRPLAVSPSAGLVLRPEAGVLRAPRGFLAGPRSGPLLGTDRAALSGGGAPGGSRLTPPSGRSRSARVLSGAAFRRAPALPGAFGSGQVHSLLCAAASMVCLACGRVFTVGAARGPLEVPCSWVPFLPSAALLLLRAEGPARLLGALPDGPIRSAAVRRGLLSRPREPD